MKPTCDNCGKILGRVRMSRGPYVFCNKNCKDRHQPGTITVSETTINPKEPINVDRLAEFMGFKEKPWLRDMFKTIESGHGRVTWG